MAVQSRINVHAVGLTYAKAVAMLQQGLGEIVALLRSPYFSLLLLSLYVYG